MRPALTTKDWEKIGRASLRWADDAESVQFRREVDEIIQKRLAKAWDQGFDRGWTAGVRDANEDDGGGQVRRPRNPYIRKE